MRILVVDDESHALNDLSNCIKDIQPTAEVYPFVRSDEALKFVQTGGQPDVAFLDIHMPVIGGIELAKELKKVLPKLNIIFCTAYSQYTVEAIRLHASGYVNKPYDKSDIQRELNNLLHPVAEAEAMPEIYVRTFGDFDLFIGGVAITFLRAKCKEMLAYLVSKRGGIANRKELAAVLFGDEYSMKTQNYLVHIYSDLVKSLKKYNAEKILIKGYNQYAVDVNLFSCDLYDYDAGKPEAVNAYKGQFMAQYDWSVFE